MRNSLIGLVLLVALLVMFVFTPLTTTTAGAGSLLAIGAVAFMVHTATSMNVTKDLVHSIKASETLYPVVVTADAAKDVGIDIIDFDSAMFVVNVGAIAAAGLVMPVAQECDTLAGSYTDVAAADLDGAFVNCVANTLQKVGYKGTKRFLAIRADYISGISVAMGGLIVAGDPHVRATV